MREMKDMKEYWERAKEKAVKYPTQVERRMSSIIHRDVPSFMELPIARTEEDLQGADVVVLGIPYEGVKIKDPLTFLPANATPMDELENVIYARSGADKAPDAIRKNSLYYSIHHGNGFFPEMDKDFVLMDEIKAVDFGNTVIRLEQDVEKTMNEIADTVKKIYKCGAVPIAMGGDHLIPYPMVKALSESITGNIGIIDFDSHLDMEWEPKFWAGSQWARIFELCIVKPENFVQIGIRGLRDSMYIKLAADELGYTYFTLTDVEEMGIREVTKQAIEIASRGTEGIYVSLDYDVMDPSSAPAQKYPDPNGLSSREMITSLKMISKYPVLGFDLCCLSPKYDYNGLGAQVAARCMIEVMGGIGMRKKAMVQTKP